MTDINATIDWVTATSQEDSVGYGWFDLYRRLAARHKKDTAERDWAGLGFNGRSTGSPRITWGFRPSDGRYILIASGALANETWLTVAPTACNVTRLDFAVTVARPADRLAEYWYRQVVAYPVDKRIKYRLIENNQGGQTLYVGSRLSARFGRLYDKSQEQGGKPGQAWRYEVEYKSNVAAEYAKNLVAAVNAGSDPGRAIASTVWRFFDGRGIRPIFSHQDGAITCQPEVTVTSYNRKLQWLRSQVRPSVEKLFQAGRGGEALEALGVTPDFLTRMADREALDQANQD